MAIFNSYVKLPEGNQSTLSHVTGLLRSPLGVVSGDSGGDGPGEAKDGGGESLGERFEGRQGGRPGGWR